MPKIARAVAPAAARVPAAGHGERHELAAAGGVVYCHCFCPACHDETKRRCVCADCGCQEETDEQA